MVCWDVALFEVGGLVSLTVVKLVVVLLVEILVVIEEEGEEEEEEEERDVKAIYIIISLIDLDIIVNNFKKFKLLVRAGVVETYGVVAMVVLILIEMSSNRMSQFCDILP